MNPDEAQEPLKSRRHSPMSEWLQLQLRIHIAYALLYRQGTKAMKAAERKRADLRALAGVAALAAVRIVQVV